MTDDLVKRLRVRAEFTGPYSALWDEAASRIEKLERENDDTALHLYAFASRIEKLEAALRLYACDCTPDDGCGVEYYDGGAHCGRTARKALEGKDD